MKCLRPEIAPKPQFCFGFVGLDALACLVYRLICPVDQGPSFYGRFNNAHRDAILTYLSQQACGRDLPLPFDLSVSKSVEGLLGRKWRQGECSILQASFDNA